MHVTFLKHKKCTFATHRLLKDDIDNVIVLVYDLTLASFVCEVISLIFGCCAVVAFTYFESENGSFGLNAIKFVLIFATLVLDLWTVGLINENNVSQIFSRMVSNDCYTRDSERDITNLASNFEQVLTFGEAVIDFLALCFDGCACHLGGVDEAMETIPFVIHGVSVFFDIVISAINFFAYVIPAFDVYNKQNDIESRCYSFEYGTSSHDTYHIDTTLTPTVDNENQDDSQLLWQQMTMIVLASIVSFTCLIWVCVEVCCKMYCNEAVERHWNELRLLFLCMPIGMGVGLFLVLLIDPWFVIVFIILCVCGYCCVPAQPVCCA